MDIPTDSCLSRDRPPRRPPAHPPSSQDSPAGCLCPRHTAVEVVNCAPDGCWRQGPGPQRPRSPAVQRGHLLPTDSTWPQRSQDLPPAPQRPEQDRTGAWGARRGSPAAARGGTGEASKVFHFPWSCLKLLRLVATFHFSFSFQKDGERSARVASMCSGQGFKGEDVDWR